MTEANAQNPAPAHTPDRLAETLSAILAYCSELWCEADQWQYGAGVADPIKAAEAAGAKQAINEVFHHVRSLRDSLRKPPA